MEIEVNKFRCSTGLLMKYLQSTQTSTLTECQVLQEFLQKEFYTAKDVEVILEFLSTKLLDPNFTEAIALAYEEYILLLVTNTISSDEKQLCTEADFGEYQSKCVMLANLMHISKDVKRYATNYFLHKPAPFQKFNKAPSSTSPPKKSKTNDKFTKAEVPLNTLSLLKCCHQLLSADPAFFKDCWNWSELVRECLTTAPTNDLQQMYSNHIVAILTNMTVTQLKQLNKNIPMEIQLEFEKEQIFRHHSLQVTSMAATIPEQYITLNLSSNHVTSVEGVLLPICNQCNYKFYTQTDGVYDKIVKVDSTKVNLRSIALGISSAKAICLSGPVGCGKTTLLEYLARKTGRIQPKRNELELEMEQLQALHRENGKENLVKDVNQLETAVGKKRKTTPDAIEEIEALLDQQQTREASSQANGFLRIQLGDQTDSKMLLGQYRCTDVPGEFIWLPGVLTQAVMHGYWLLLEDLDAATQDTFTILSGLLENGFLSVPGFRDCVKIEPGFQLFVTVRTNKSANTSQKSLFTLLEKHLYTINILPLSRNELCKVVSCNYPKLATVANRIVDVFLTFSSGDHNSADNLRQQESVGGDKADTTEKYLALPFEQVTLPTTTNSGRLVSTRDLIKLCQRSNPMFSVTSAECAYFVFQNAVDVFCSYLPQGKEKTKLICSIGAKLGIIQSRCEFFANDYKPEVITDQERIKVGRAELFTKSIRDESKKVQPLERREELHAQALKRIKLSQNTERGVSSQTVANKKSSGTFSFTRLASCVLERVAVCVAHEEPVLLVGETGVGKTSAVQYLAERTQHKLVVVNMNNQSDVSDLVGGFKPVDLTYVVTPLRNEFELLFRCTFNQAKNETFLNKFAICYNQGNYPVIIKLMLKIVSSVFEKSSRNEMRPKELEYLPRWQTLRIKLSKLSTQLAKSINISFAFIPGSLVNCIKNGDWVLLDEINLASAETLECLSTILEPDGSVVLLEKGDFTPVKRHPDFRIFACMNPNTDIGKKDLSVGIRNRFTEFFVDELTTESDLTLLISDYLASTGIQKKIVSNIVKLYKKLTALSKLELNDGLGNRPVFSLRTLCRALRVCAKNLCGSIERNLYESFCMSFLTQLDPVSHQLVLQLIRDSLLSNVKAVLMQGIPKPGENFLNFEGYWIEQGPKPLQDCEHYILTESVRDNLKDLARIIAIGKLPILLQGPTSAGKTSLIEFVAKRSGNQCLRINNHEHTDLQEYIGTYAADLTGKLSFREGVLVQAMRNGYWIILDELNLASTDILEALNRVLDDNRELFIPETQTVVRAHPNFMLFATQNPPGLYGGRKTLSRAFKNRFIELHFAEIPRHELELILEKRCHIPPSYSKKMVLCMAELQKNRKTTTAKNVFTLRDLFRWGNRYTYADEKLLADNKYDWNQHLIEEGYLVLSAKVRTDIEIEIIEETLYRNFKKRINLESLFDVYSEKDSSPVTQDILRSLKSFKRRTDIVWTRPMTRMAVLTAKAVQFNEPVLLVGPTGCGKTTICQVLASLRGVTLRILNCHMHTEGADFLGGLRPCRQTKDDGVKQLFEWADGPLIYAMQEGSYFMADEISLAEDSVLERLNCILEPERTVLLAEKGGVAGETEEQLDKQFVVKAKQGFQFLATMNPGGDFGKKELSPALRNRFTEVWCHPSDTREDLIQIANNCLLRNESLLKEDSLKVATYLVDVVLFMRDHVEKFKYSVRDILAWAQYMISNETLSFPERAIFGLETVFLDAFEMLPHESLEKVELLKKKIIDYAISQSSILMGIQFTLPELLQKRGSEIVFRNSEFGIKPFLITTSETINNTTNKNFLFDAPTTKKNLFRLLSALSLKKPVLLEGPPGVGKTSIVESLAQAIGYQIVRINLCEHTDLADLFGTDLPAEDNASASSTNADDDVAILENVQGSFAWRDGPLLAALKSQNTWILLDELNLAPQSVLEGLNAILDHRGEVYIPELNKSFQLSQQTRIFACQNPLRQGGGRKGLPQSFLNRFNKVYLRKLTTDDLLFVVNGKYSQHFEEIRLHFCEILRHIQLPEERNLFKLHQELFKSRSTDIDACNNSAEFLFDLSERLVLFSERLENSIANMEFGYKGGPYEINLRDILRWCDLLINPETGFILNKKHVETFKLESNSAQLFQQEFENFMLTLYERMKLVYYQRMRSPQDKLFIRNTFSTIFNCNADLLNVLSEDVALYWTDDKVYLNDIVMRRSTDNEDGTLRPLKMKSEAPLLLTSQREFLKNLVECVHMEKPVLLCGPTDAGKTKIINALCTLSNQLCNTDSIDDSVTGSFQQIDLNRHLEEISRNVETLLTVFVQNNILNSGPCSEVVKLLNVWCDYNRLTKTQPEFDSSAILSEELNIFRKRIELLNVVIEQLLVSLSPREVSSKLQQQQRLLSALTNRIRSAESLNTGGSFEWVDSKIVQSLKHGQYINLEHVNLCSSAVLDRLNPVFEPNGRLLISEKGVTAQDEAEIVEKAPNFRAFLTLDPKNGELSRAMRNRCIELALTKDTTTYDIDDMRAIIHSSGITDIVAINYIIRIHERIIQLTEINQYTISHLTHFAGLTAAYKRIGYGFDRAIYVAGMEVYVYAANMDLMGYGLDYYQNKLREIVLEEMKSFPSKQLSAKEDHLVNVILNCSDLSASSLVRLQLEPLRIMLTQKEKNIQITQTDLAQLFNAFENYKLNADIGVDDILKYYIYLLYETSTIEDLKLRHAYLTDLMAPHSSQMHLQQLSQKLFTTLQNISKHFDPVLLPSLPWNTKLFPRLRDYATHSLNASSKKAYCLSAQLLAQLIVPELPQADSHMFKLQQIDALSYSQAVTANAITDKLKNTFLQYLAGFLQRLHDILNTVLENAALDLHSYTQIITKLFWFKRLLASSQQKLFIANELNTNVLDKLLLHFKWLDKHLLQLFAKILPNYRQLNAEFESSLQKLTAFVLSVKHPLNLLRKNYAKQLTDFQPFYKEEQISLLSLTQKLDSALTVIPSYGSYTPEVVLKKFIAQKSDAASRCRAKLLQQHMHNKYNFNFKEVDVSFAEGEHLPPNLKNVVLQFITSNKEINKLTSSSLNAAASLDLDTFSADLESIQQLVNSDDEIPAALKPKELQLALFPLREYFLVKCLAVMLTNTNTKNATCHLHDVNECYFESLPSLSSDTLQLLQVIKTPKYRNFIEFWSTLSSHLETLQTAADFKQLVTYLKANYSSVSTFRRLIGSASIQLQLNSLANRAASLSRILLRNSSDITSSCSYSGPALIQSLRALIYSHDGTHKAVPLNELSLWKQSLREMRQLLWLNSNLMSSNFSTRVHNLAAAQLNSKKLLFEVAYVQELCENAENENFNDYNENFKKLVHALSDAAATVNSSDAVAQQALHQHASEKYRCDLYQTSLLNTLIGAIEVCLLSFTPLIDPVEKNRLKSAYLLEDINCLTTLTTVYDFMRIVMKYKHFGNELYTAFCGRLDALAAQQHKFSQKVALRPERCLYNSLVQDIKHFLATNCDPQALLKLIQSAQFAWSSLSSMNVIESSALDSCTETLNKIELWLANSQRFVHHILQRYTDYYQDFIQPLQCSVNQTRFGFEGLKMLLTQLKASFVPSSMSNSQMAKMDCDGKLHRLLANIIEFPSTHALEVYNVKSSRDIQQNRSPIFNILDKIEGSEYDLFRLIKAKITELHNLISISSNISEEEFRDFDFTFNVCNQIWQEEEERRRQRKVEAESLYVTKTKCETEDEELIELQEIEENFPTNVQEDFGEFVQEDTLEKVLKLNDKHKDGSPRINPVIRDEDYAFLVDNFITVLENYSRIYYYNPEISKSNNDYHQLDIIEPFKERMRVFVKIFEHYQPSLNEWLDEQAFSSFSLAVGLQQQMLNELSFPVQKTCPYNFYKDSNIPEIISCTELLQRIEDRVQVQLALYPEHAGLSDIIRVIERIRSLPSTAPVVRFNTGFQILRQKISLWNEVAHKNNHLRDEEIQVAEYVQKWTKLELQFWRNCLSQTYRQVEVQAYKYWFFIYNLFQQYMLDHEIDNSLTDIKYTEKRFAYEETLDEVEVENKSKVEARDVIRILRQFVESSNYGDFHVRLQLLQSFEFYLHIIDRNSTNALSKERKNALVAGLRNLQIYFSQFSQEIEDTKKSMRSPIEKKLKEFVKIESYNKDLSYFSMRNNIAKVHRQLNKFLKEYRLQLQQKISPVFQPKDATVKDYNIENDKGKDLRYESKIKYHMVDVKTFIAPQNLLEKLSTEKLKESSTPSEVPENLETPSLLQRVKKHFCTSRNVVKEIVTNARYTKLIIALDDLFCQQLERCDHLRKLEVDRSKDRPQQKLEAKQILQQKRKALSDIFKSLSKLGISYKSGLMELSLRSEFEDFTLPPFCIMSMMNTPKDKRTLMKLNENLDKYFAKSVFKLRLLQNIMLSPLSELGLPNIERIKGNAVDLFLLVQNQRHLLASTTKNIYDLRQLMQSLKQVAEIAGSTTLNDDMKHLEFTKLRDHFLALKNNICHIRYVFEQFILLLTCVPEQQDEENRVLSRPYNEYPLLYPSSEHFLAISKHSHQILNATKNALSDMLKYESEFISLDKLNAYQATHAKIVSEIRTLIGYCRDSSGDYLPICRSLTELLSSVEITTVNNFNNNCSETGPSEFENINTELENMIHCVLLSLQKLFKKYRKPAVDKDEPKASPKRNEEENEDDTIQEHHLKRQLLHELLADCEVLNLPSVITKLTNIMLVLKHAPASKEKLSNLHKVISAIPILEQFQLVAEYYLCQQLSAHKVSAKMLSVMLTVFVEISTKGFCVPADLMQDEEGESKKDQKEGEGFGLEDGTGEKDASDKLESEDQLDDAKRPEDRKDDENKNQDDCKEEKGIEMNDDFDGKMQDIEKPENEENDSAESEEDEEDLNKEMGETEEGADKLDDQIWGDDEEPQPEEEDEQEKQMEEEDGKGSKDEKEPHNDLDSKNDAAKEGKDEHDKDGLDATNEPNNDKKKQDKEDIDNMKDPEIDEEQINPYHNELEEPPEAEEMDLGNMNNVDEEQEEGEEQQGDDNPFDIDAMKENMETREENHEAEEEEQEKNEEEDNQLEAGEDESDSDEGEAGTDVKEDKDAPTEETLPDESNKEEEETEPETQKRGDLELEEEEEKEQQSPEAEERAEKPEEYEESKDKPSKEENVQSVQETKSNGSADQVQNDDENKEDVRQEQKMDEQETGEEKDGVGQAENDTNEGGHQGIADTKETVSQEEQKNERQTEEKRKQGRTDEERTLGEAEKNKLKQLKTIDKLKNQKENDTSEDQPNEKEMESEEYQHVREPKNSDKTTLDNATEEQTKQIQHLEDEEMTKDEENEGENEEELMEVNESEGADQVPEDTNLEEMSAEKFDQKSEKPSKSEKTNERAETQEDQMEVEGVIVPTTTVLRSDDTTAHCIKEILLDNLSTAEELSNAETLELRKMYQQQLTTAHKSGPPQHEDYETWQTISNRMIQNARELCEQLRLILEPTKCTRLKGDYRTGRRINMKKIIPYIASQFRKDKIWLRRTKPAQRDYKITIAIDDSKSMHHNNSKTLTLEAISLVAQALTLLESGRLSIVSFGEMPQIVLHHTEQLDGPNLVNALTFAQDKTKIAELLDFVRTVNTEEGALGSDNGLFENLLLVLSDGRNIFSEGKTKVKNAIKLARLQRMFLVYIIIDNPENKNSILDIQTMEVLPDKRINIKSYLDDFPFPYYVIVRDLNQLPLVLSEAMRQWFELVNSEQ